MSLIVLINWLAGNFLETCLQLQWRDRRIEQNRKRQYRTGQQRKGSDHDSFEVNVVYKILLWTLFSYTHLVIHTTSQKACVLKEVSSEVGGAFISASFVGLLSISSSSNGTFDWSELWCILDYLIDNAKNTIAAVFVIYQNAANNLWKPHSTVDKLLVQYIGAIYHYGTA